MCLCFYIYKRFLITQLTYTCIKTVEPHKRLSLTAFNDMMRMKRKQVSSAYELD